ncbi:hypothetical protein SAMN04488074_105111 [Lentzea albidocapillata subsp. violacea]|uniref:Uncharacterized protein n=1 Tax=Lentzea albidocapillata subsp. violacea TaxID=128104 RepID=A0A1G9AU59_9PSEU|nr:hypothetical protein [Lentzea albidocapillata]SDK30434.1 hypothetical protein SAMN04488074_105111 [Lentzea albidocapillata subsp. violacea]
MDVYSTLRAKSSLVPVARTASANGTGVDRNDNGLGYQDAMVVVHTGAITDGTHTIEVQDSDDNASFAAVADAYLLGTEPVIASTDDNKTYDIGYTGSKRYLRAIVTAAGTTTGGVYGATVILANPRVAPAVHS